MDKKTNDSGSRYDHETRRIKLSYFGGEKYGNRPYDNLCDAEPQTEETKKKRNGAHAQEGQEDEAALPDD